MDLARETLQEAISICGISWPLGAPVFSGSLALLHAIQGRSSEAFQLLGGCEDLLKGCPEELGKLLCKKGRIQLLANDPGAARESLAQAQAIAGELNVGEHSELAKAISNLQKLMASTT
jgi:hypothetical protein